MPTWSECWSIPLPRYSRSLPRRSSLARTCWATARRATSPASPSTTAVWWSCWTPRNCCRRQSGANWQPHKNMTPAITLSEPELKLLQTLVYEQGGRFFDARRAHFLQDRLHRRLRACRLESFYSYYRLLTSREGRTELAALLENLTVNETSFFRNKPQLELFHKTTLDELLRRKQAERDYTLRLWSAGCSTGQEPYTMAMMVCDSLSYFILRNAPVGQHPSPKPLVA